MKVNDKASPVFYLKRGRSRPSCCCRNVVISPLFTIYRVNPHGRNRASTTLLVQWTVQVKLGQVQAQVEFELVIVGFHMFTQLIKSFVVVVFFKVR